MNNTPSHNTQAFSSTEKQEDQVIEQAFQHLLQTYLSSNHRKKTEIITKAFNFSKSAHKGVRRKSGEPYILHPIAVAQIICEEIGLGSTSICAALLHDVIEDTDYTREDIANLFGHKIANIVEGLTKVSGGLLSSNASVQAETFKKILLTMSDDIRVILVKIADRLHNMRTLSSMPASKQHKVSGETLYIFAPIADRLGLNRIKTELEDLSFRYEHPREYNKIIEQLNISQMQRDDAINDFTPPIRQALDKLNLQYQIKARIKSPYSIWQKMQRKKVSFQEIYDILAIRIIFRPNHRETEIQEAYNIYASLTQIYKPHPSRFRDWLSTPKANGYQALHNTFMSNQGKWIEVQIRSDRMDDIAEGGFAAHWKYKEKDAQYDEHELDTWVNSIKEILDDPQPNTLDLLDTIKLNLFASELNVFTPKGEIITLPQGSTLLDFAFAIHTMIGTHCIGGKINHHLAPLSQPLSNGDQVDIITSQSLQIKPQWLNFVTTGKAKGKIESHLRKLNREKQRQGEEIVKAFLNKHLFIPNEANINKLKDKHGCKTPAELFLSVAEKDIILGITDQEYLRGRQKKKGWKWSKLITFLKRKNAQVGTEIPYWQGKISLEEINRKQTLLLSDDILQQSTLCTHCHPICGDSVMGYIADTQTLELHRIECPVALQHKTRFGHNIVATRWEAPLSTSHSYTIQLLIEGIDATGVLHNIAETLLLLPQFTLTAINLSSNDGIFTGKLDISVHNTNDVQIICENLQKIPQVEKAVRIL